MSRALIVRLRAERQAAAARDWYDERLEGLGREFIEELGSAILKAQQHPLHYQSVHLEIRRVLLRRFPYGVFYVAEEERVVVLAVLHQSENPEKWRKLD